MTLQYEEYVPLREYTTMKTGGVARYFVVVTTVEELGAALSFAEQKKVPHLILGGGSNLLVSDEGFPGVVIKMAITGRHYEVIDDEVVRLRAGAGEVFDEVVADTVARGYFGLENLSAIPGTVGATPVQNVGAYGVEVKDCILAVEAYHIPSAAMVLLTNEACQFAYRDSLFKTEAGLAYVIVAVQFTLRQTGKAQISYRDLALYFKDTASPSLSAVREAVITIRSEKFPNWHVVGTAGSFFKNPIIKTEVALELKHRYPELPVYEVDAAHMKISLGYVLDKICGLKGFTEGPVGLYEKQALVLVQHGGATTGEVLAFAREVEARVYAATGLMIEREVRFV